MTALRLVDVGAGYGGRPVVSGISVTVPAGSWLAVIGPNGAGKSTLLKAIAGLVGRTGQVWVGGRDAGTLSGRRRAREIGYAPQSPALPPELTVTDYVLLGRTPYLRPLAGEGPADRAIVGEVLERLDLGALAGRRLVALSGGERQRAVLARTLAQRTGLLLLDEPTSGLDVGHAQALLELVDRLRTEDGTTVVSTLHDLTLAGQYADDLLLLDGGVAVAHGPAATVLTAPLLSRHYGATVDVLSVHDQPVVAPYRAPRQR
ncbi:MAG TPA: ABC transporter ATP-binding protein [Pseudonocardiaceae bacterium]|jgi:iron complex transport system ATP-binding protein|nr:ABC transporter ATP-binding protein [Pseudonocardiaceae bacterium]